MDVISKLNMSAIHKCLELFPVHPLFSCYVYERSKRHGKSHLTELSDGVANIRMLLLSKATNKGNLKNNNVFELR
jgi:hypothetical protein